MVDGDTVILESGEKVRLLGINAPEKEFEQRPAQPYSLEALLALEEMVKDATVKLVAGKQQTDSYGRTLGYLESNDGVDVQHALVLRGYAFVVAFPPDVDRVERYLAAERIARSEGRGIWDNDVLEVIQLDRHVALESGFGLFAGKVLSVNRSRKNVRLIFGSGLVTTIRHDDWNEFWHDDPESLLDRRMELRGWLRKARDNSSARYYLRVRHPSMIQTIP